MLKKYFILVVLVMGMVKTNAQSPFYYFYGEQIALSESDDKLLVTAYMDIEEQDMADLMEKISNDNDFELVSPGTGGYLVLRKLDNSTITKQAAISRYISEPGVAYAAYVYEGSSGNFAGISHDILVRPKEGISFNDVQNMAAQYNLVSAEVSSFNSNVYRLYFPKQGTLSTLEIANELYETGDFIFSEPDFFKSHKANSLLSSTCTTPSLNDPQFGNQWNLYNNGVAGTTWCDVSVCHAWDKTKGNGIIVAVVDDGMDTRHQDLASNYVPGYDAVPYGVWCGWTCQPFYLTDPGCASNGSGHGTACAGIIGAEQNNSLGISGVAPEVSLMPVRIYYYNAIFAAYETNSVWEADGINWAYQHADVLSNSWSYPVPGYSAAVDMEIDDALTLGRGNDGRGCVVVFSVGNDDAANINWPASKTGVISVGAMSMCDERKSPASCDGQTWWGGNYGYGVTPFSSGFLSVVAPGVDVPTTAPWTNAYANFAGTSASAPHVAGVAALMLSVNPCLTNAEVKDIIELTADKVGGYAYATSQPNGAWDDEMGYGRLNASNAVAWANDMYRQNETVSATQVYSAYQKIYAGYDVDITQIKAMGNYVLTSGADITFKAPIEINLKEGFEVQAGAIFTAQIIANPPTCNDSHAHYRQPVPEVQQQAPKTAGGDRYVSRLTVYPNPVRNDLNISFMLNTETKVIFSILALDGRQTGIYIETYLQAAKHVQTLKTDKLVPGVYMVLMQTNSGSKYFRFIKE